MKTKQAIKFDDIISQYFPKGDKRRGEVLAIVALINIEKDVDNENLFTRKQFRAFGEFCASLRTDYLLAMIEKHTKSKYNKFSKTTNLKLYPDGYKDFGITFKEIEKIFKERVK